MGAQGSEGVARHKQELGDWSLAAGLFCNRTFDDYACWPDGAPGSFVNVSCPWYLPWANNGESLGFPHVQEAMEEGSFAETQPPPYTLENAQLWMYSYPLTL